MDTKLFDFAVLGSDENALRILEAKFGEPQNPTEQADLLSELAALVSARKATLIGTSEPSKVSLLKRAKAALDKMTVEENAAITAAARTDPDAQPNLVARRGRPRSEHAKVAILLRLDPDIVESFKKSGAGWQTRMNGALRKAADLD